MKNILYYVVDLSTRNYDGFEEVEGKNITLYVIVDNKPISVTSFYLGIEDDTEEEIKVFLDSEDHSEKTFALLEDEEGNHFHSSNTELVLL